MTGRKLKATLQLLELPGTPKIHLVKLCFLNPPAVGSQVVADESYAEVESVKAVSDVIAPLSGEIVEVNEALADTPEVLNTDPYKEGWMIKVKLADPEEVGQLLTHDAYTSSLE